ncbi:hypothetical protein F5Y05DRAFT_418507 [Hypoxylon sp. FL0543]|nr:hypothetical protein F5Y05DRAFT_418507 [Hypoxylon sp. FL0543]
MATKQSTQLRKGFCGRARRRDPAVTSFFARRVERGRGQYDGQDDMPSTTTFNTNYYLNRNNDDYGGVSQPTILPQTRLPNRVFKLTQPRSLQPATRNEIYGLAIGTCFLILLIGFLFLIAIRASCGIFTKKPEKANRETDPESGPAPEPPEKSYSILSKLRKVSTEEFIKSARLKSLDVAAGIKRDIGEFRMNHSARHSIDEEAGLFGVKGGGIATNGHFLRRKRRVVVA